MVGIIPLRITSANMQPGPTEGNWSASPTSISLHSAGSAFNSALMSEMSTIEHSSRITASQVSGSSSSRLKTISV